MQHALDGYSIFHILYAIWFVYLTNVRCPKHVDLIFFSIEHFPNSVVSIRYVFKSKEYWHKHTDTPNKFDIFFFQSDKFNLQPTIVFVNSRFILNSRPIRIISPTWYFFLCVRSFWESMFDVFSFVLILLQYWNVGFWSIFSQKMEFYFVDIFRIYL